MLPPIGFVGEAQGMCEVFGGGVVMYVPLTVVDVASYNDGAVWV